MGARHCSAHYGRWAQLWDGRGAAQADPHAVAPLQRPWARGPRDEHSNPALGPAQRSSRRPSRAAQTPGPGSPAGPAPALPPQSSPPPAAGGRGSEAPSLTLAPPSPLGGPSALPKALRAAEGSVGPRPGRMDADGRRWRSPRPALTSSAPPPLPARRTGLTRAGGKGQRRRAMMASQGGGTDRLKANRSGVGEGRTYTNCGNKSACKPRPAQ